MEKEINKETMTNLFGSLLGSFENDKIERVSIIKDSIKALNLDWTSPEEIDLLHINRLLEHVDIMVKDTYPNVSRKNLHTIQFIYRHYGFINNNVESLADLGNGCSADKSRWIIGACIDFLVGGEAIVFPTCEDKEHSYYHPNFGTFKEWYDFVDGLTNLYYHGISKSNMANTLNLLKKQTEAKEELAKESKIANDYMPTYDNKVNEFVLNGLLTEIEKVEALTRYAKSMVVFGLIKEIIANTLTDSMLLSKIKEKIRK